MEALRLKLAAMEERMEEEKKKSFEDGMKHYGDRKRAGRAKKKAEVDAIDWSEDIEKNQRKATAPGGNSHSSKTHTGFRYFDEFLQLRCSVQMIDSGMFPNAKEVAESFAAFNAIRRHLIGSKTSRTKEQWEAAIVKQKEKRRQQVMHSKGAYLPPLAHVLTSANTCPADKGIGVRDANVAVLVVGDGGSPRIAGTCALRTKWTCMSVDPQIADSIDLTKQEALPKWHVNPIERVLCVPALIQDVDLAECLESKEKEQTMQSFDKLVVVLMHSHVTLRQALQPLVRSKWSGSFLGVVACPCCNWSESQSMIAGRPPTVEYVDDCMGTVKNEIRVWRFSDDELCSLLSELISHEDEHPMIEERKRQR